MLDALSNANELAELLPGPNPHFAVTIGGLRPTVTSAQRFAVPVVPLDGCSTGLGDSPCDRREDAGPLEQALTRPDVAEAGDALRAWAADGVRIAAACVGTFLVAESGLLDGYDATTSWWLTPLFRQRYPEVRLDARRMLVPSGRFVTAGAALGHIDLALWLIRQASPELAALVAKYLIVDSRPMQSAYAISDHLAHADPLVERFDRWARARLAQGFNLDEAATALGTSKRTLARRLRDVLGKTPISYVQDLRIEQAVHLLKTGDSSVERIAEMVGYADGVTLRSLLRRRLGKGVREIKSA